MYYILYLASMFDRPPPYPSPPFLTCPEPTNSSCTPLSYHTDMACYPINCRLLIPPWTPMLLLSLPLFGDGRLAGEMALWVSLSLSLMLDIPESRSIVQLSLCSNGPVTLQKKQERNKKNNVLVPDTCLFFLITYPPSLFCVLYRPCYTPTPPQLNAGIDQRCVTLWLHDRLFPGCLKPSACLSTYLPALSTSSTAFLFFSSILLESFKTTANSALQSNHYQTSQ